MQTRVPVDPFPLPPFCVPGTLFSIRCSPNSSPKNLTRAPAATPASPWRFNQPIHIASSSSIPPMKASTQTGASNERWEAPLSCTARQPRRLNPGTRIPGERHLFMSRCSCVPERLSIFPLMSVKKWYWECARLDPHCPLPRAEKHPSPAAPLPKDPTVPEHVLFARKKREWDRETFVSTHCLGANIQPQFTMGQGVFWGQDVEIGVEFPLNSLDTIFLKLFFDK